MMRLLLFMMSALACARVRTGGIRGGAEPRYFVFVCLAWSETKMSEEFFTRETWRASKRRKMQKRTKPWGGRKTAPPAFLEAAKRTWFTAGHANHRICRAMKRDGSPCGMLAFSGLSVCGAHGGFWQWARQGRLQKSGRGEAARAAMVEGRAPVVSLELIRLPMYRQANDWTRIRLARAWGTEAWPSLIKDLRRIGVCV